MAAAKALDEEQALDSPGSAPDAKSKAVLDVPEGEAAPDVVGPYLVGVKLTRREKFTAW